MYESNVSPYMNPIILKFKLIDLRVYLTALLINATVALMPTRSWGGSGFYAGSAIFPAGGTEPNPL